MRKSGAPRSANRLAIEALQVREWHLFNRPGLLDPEAFRSRFSHMTCNLARLSGRKFRCHSLMVGVIVERVA